MKLITGLLLALLVAACVPPSAIADRQPAPSILSVDNEYDNAVDIWVVHEGAKERKVGTVEAYTQSLFLLQANDYVTGTLQLFIYCRLDGHYLTTEAIPLQVGTPVKLDLNSQGGFLYPRQADHHNELQHT